jgi:hypothetical protein
VDTFSFQGTAGDTVTLTLDANFREGNNGGNARLTLSGGALRAAVRGALPLGITAPLAADGQYAVAVDQATHPEEEQFRGSYILTITPTTGTVEAIEPAADVER